MKKIYFGFLAALASFISCNKEMTHPVSSANFEGREAPSVSSNLIVISAPSVTNTYYQKAGAFQDLINFDIAYAQTVMQGTDKVVVLADKKTLPYLSALPDSVLLQSNVQDIWIRDFGPMMPGKDVKFKYSPDYLQKNLASLIDQSFNSAAANSGVVYAAKTSIVLDGGNFVDNGKDKVVITNRILKDNPGMSQSQLVNKIKSMTGVKTVCIVPEESGDTTGHADGMVMWLDTNKIGVTEMPYDTVLRKQVVQILQSAFPTVQIIYIPDSWDGQYFDGFASACGLYVNSAVTDNYIYVPVYGDASDQDALNIIQQNTNKKVVAIDASQVCFLGGAVRCLAWQVKGANVAKMISAAKTK